MNIEAPFEAAQAFRDPSDMAWVIAENAADAIFMMDAEGRIAFANPAAERIFGWQQPELLGQVLHDLLHHHHPDGQAYPRETCPIAQAYRSGHTLVGHEDVFFCRDGTPLSVSCSNSPVARAGEIVGSVLTVQDISERKRTEAALRESEVFLRSVLESSPDCVKVVDLEGRLVFMNGPGLCVMEIGDFAAIRNKTWSSLWPEEATAQIDEAIAAAKRGSSSRFNAFCPTAKGTPKWWEVTVTPIQDQNGTVTNLLSISRDVTDRKEAEELRLLMTRELHHRVKNTLATVQAVISATARRAQSVSEFYRAVSDRIVSLARTHTLLVNEEWGGATVRDLFLGELAPYDTTQSGRIKLEGPQVLLTSEIALALGMAAHELTTNAAKYGALSLPDGRVEVRWSLKENHPECLLLEWHEQGGPPVQPPTRQGFGTVLLNRVLGRQLKGEVQVEYGAEGLRVSVQAPLAQAHA